RGQAHWAEKCFHVTGSPVGQTRNGLWVGNGAEGRVLEGQAGELVTAASGHLLGYDWSDPNASCGFACGVPVLSDWGLTPIVLLPKRVGSDVIYQRFPRFQDSLRTNYEPANADEDYA